jgi:hypothetical protein
MGNTCPVGQLTVLGAGTDDWWYERHNVTNTPAQRACVSLDAVAGAGARA